MRTHAYFVGLFVAACGGGGTDIDATLRFADRSDAEISRLVSAASGSEGFQAQSQVSQFDEPFEPDPCPTIDISGNQVTITGGCTTMDGVAVSGTATISNPLGWGDLEYDFGADSVYEFSGFAIEQSGFRTAFDGVVRQAASFRELDMDLTMDMMGIAVRSDIYMDCDTSGCDIEGSGVELVGVGGARVSGSVTVSGQSASSRYTLRGQDTVRVVIENNCVSWQLDGTDRGFSPCRQ